jgi:hypothetical protein
MLNATPALGLPNQGADPGAKVLKGARSICAERSQHVDGLPAGTGRLQESHPRLVLTFKFHLSDLKESTNRLGLSTASPIRPDRPARAADKSTQARSSQVLDQRPNSRRPVEVKRSAACGGVRHKLQTSRRTQEGDGQGDKGRALFRARPWGRLPLLLLLGEGERTARESKRAKHKEGRNEETENCEAAHSSILPDGDVPQ